MEITVNTLSYIICNRSTWSIFLFFSCSHSGLSPNKLVESSLFMSVPQTSIGKSFKRVLVCGFWTSLHAAQVCPAAAFQPCEAYSAIIAPLVL